ncbi:hypothetical protein [Caldicoprobacter algeriensis]|uniref:hypothetical protein n=1 Tax=Caldicoprobacter algeriensis TaxID=699281 RepID=UPI00207A389A|nr:hypothetical protein [Caldicoprobacter algeriensis]
MFFRRAQPFKRAAIATGAARELQDKGVASGASMVFFYINQHLAGGTLYMHI